METTNVYGSTRIWKKTLKKLRKIGAETEESIVKLLDRLADEELSRLKKEEEDESRKRNANL